MSSSAALSESVEEYLEAIRKLGKTRGGVSTSRLAHRLGVTPASVTGMLRRLAELGLITYQRYRNVTLTARGSRRANEVIRRHRLAERLLTDVLGVPLEEAHDEACRLEHAVSPAVASRIARTLGSPAECPHGNPIDVDAGDETLSLVDAPLNRALTIVRLDDETPKVVRHLAERNLLPGARVRVVLREPLDGTAVLDVGGETQTLGPRLAASIRVRTARRKRASARGSAK